MNNREKIHTVWHRERIRVCICDRHTTTTAHTMNSHTQERENVISVNFRIKLDLVGKNRFCWFFFFISFAVRYIHVRLAHWRICAVRFCKLNGKNECYSVLWTKKIISVFFFIQKSEDFLVQITCDFDSFPMIWRRQTHNETLTKEINYQKIQEHFPFEILHIASFDPNSETRSRKYICECIDVFWNFTFQPIVDRFSYESICNCIFSLLYWFAIANTLAEWMLSITVSFSHVSHYRCQQYYFIMWILYFDLRHMTKTPPCFYLLISSIGICIYIFIFIVFFSHCIQQPLCMWTTTSEWNGIRHSGIRQEKY